MAENLCYNYYMFHYSTYKMTDVQVLHRLQAIDEIMNKPGEKMWLLLSIIILFS